MFCVHFGDLGLAEMGDWRQFDVALLPSADQKIIKNKTTALISLSYLQTQTQEGQQRT